MGYAGGWSVADMMAAADGPCPALGRQVVGPAGAGRPHDRHDVLGPPLRPCFIRGDVLRAQAARDVGAGRVA